jgi:hypothetical protein
LRLQTFHTETNKPKTGLSQMLYKKQKAQPLLHNDTPFLRALLVFSRHPKKAKQSREKALQTYNEKIADLSGRFLCVTNRLFVFSATLPR